MCSTPQKQPAATVASSVFAGSAELEPPPVLVTPMLLELAKWRAIRLMKDDILWCSADGSHDRDGNVKVGYMYDWN